MITGVAAAPFLFLFCGVNDSDGPSGFDGRWESYIVKIVTVDTAAAAPDTNVISYDTLPIPFMIIEINGDLATTYNASTSDCYYEQMVVMSDEGYRFDEDRNRYTFINEHQTGTLYRQDDYLVIENIGFMTGLTGESTVKKIDSYYLKRRPSETFHPEWPTEVCDE
jgi:hypothetical protein